MTSTPLIKLENFFIKREDLNITGSAKDRSIPLQIKNLIKLGFKQAVISSTGNAAISAAFFCQQNNIELTIFLSPKVSRSKLKIIKKYHADLKISNKPISDAIKFSKKNKAYLLRQSTDPTSLVGYQNIGQEIIDQLPQTTSIFVPIGSGTTLLGISQKIPNNIKIFGVQSAANCSIGQKFDNDYKPEKKLITDALSAKFIPNKTKIINAIQKTNGSVFVINNKDIKKSYRFLKHHKIKTSLEGALSLAGYQKSITKKIDPGKYPVIILTGALR